MSKIINGDTMSVEIIDENNFEEIITNALKDKIENIILFIDEEVTMIDKISWIWGVSFSTLKNINKIYCCGKRNRDIFLKLKLDNLENNIFLEQDYKKLIDNVSKESSITKIITSNWSKDKLKDYIIK